MSHFGRAGPPDIRDTYSLLVLNITFRTTADDLFPLFDKYGKVVDVFIPRDRRTGDSRGFAFVRYKYADEAQKAVEKLDGRVVDGREIMVQFAKYGPNAERIHKGGYLSLWKKLGGQGAEVLGPGTGMIIGTETTGEVAIEVEVGEDTSVMATRAVETETTVAGVGARAQVPTTAGTVEEADIMTTGEVEAVLMKVTLLVEVATVLDGAHRHAGPHLLGT